MIRGDDLLRKDTAGILPLVQVCSLGRSLCLLLSIFHNQDAVKLNRTGIVCWYYVYVNVLALDTVQAVCLKKKSS